MGQIFDIAKPTPRKTSVKSHTHNNSSKRISNAWIYFGLVIIIFLIIADFGNNTKTQIVTTNQNDNPSNSKVLGNNTNSETSPDINQSIPESTDDKISQPVTNDITNPIKDSQTGQNTFDKSQVKIRILNGSKSAGAANTAKEKLIANGYVIDSVGTAKNKYNVTTIYYNKNKKDIATMVQLVLENQNTLLEENVTLTANYDILIVIGSK
ncbi:MAG: hypothetical protein ACD_58C00324G0011 [uncultured bacterium]|nr:MAG: hypothetical protein ACD_58C00324G0011 [uncultured bacterium]